MMIREYAAAGLLIDDAGTADKPWCLMAMIPGPWGNSQNTLLHLGAYATRSQAISAAKARIDEGRS